jgi:predicted metal-binding membrane protein
MVVLVAAGAMSLKWVLAISLVVFAEKVMPGGWRTARFAGWALIAAGVAVAARPELAAMLKPHGMH